jgi:hypothetical protein
VHGLYRAGLSFYYVYYLPDKQKVSFFAERLQQVVFDLLHQVQSLIFEPFDVLELGIGDGADNEPSFLEHIDLPLLLKGGYLFS